MKKFVGYGYKRKTESIEEALGDYLGWEEKLGEKLLSSPIKVARDIENHRQAEEIGPHETVEIFKITITPVAKKSKKRAKK